MIVDEYVGVESETFKHLVQLVKFQNGVEEELSARLARRPLVFEIVLLNPTMLPRNVPDNFKDDRLRTVLHFACLEVCRKKPSVQGFSLLFGNVRVVFVTICPENESICCSRTHTHTTHTHTPCTCTHA